MALLTEQEVEQTLADLPAWTREGDAIVRAAEASSFPEGIRLVTAVADLAESRNHHPDIDIRYTTVTFRLSTHSEGGLTMADMELAAAIDQLLR